MAESVRSSRQVCMASSWLQLLVLLLLLHRQVHAIVTHSVTYEMRVMTDTAEIEPLTAFDLLTDVQILQKSGLLRVSTRIHFSDTGLSFPVAYYPSTELFGSFCSRFYAGFAPIGSAQAKNAFCQRLRLHLQSTLAEASIGQFRLTLWRHNLRDLGPDPEPPVVIVYSYGVHEITVALECLFVFAFSRRPVIIMSEDEFAHTPAHQTAPDVFVFSVLDGICSVSLSNPWCRDSSDGYVKQYGRTNRTTLVMVSGEHWNVNALDERVVLLSTVSQVNRSKHVYLPVASTSFAERVDQSPLALLKPYAEVEPSGMENQSRRFCAYMYARCDRPQREYMFDLLNAIEPVDALGVCAGNRRPPNPSQKRGRESLWFNDAAVKIYERYKFVIAFENDQEPGYVTEKLVNAFLAGSIPVYLGHSETVTQIFNSRSFIDCGQSRTLRDCAARVKQVHESAQMYAEMRREPPVANASAFHDAFSWHPDIPSKSIADALRGRVRQIGIRSFRTKTVCCFSTNQMTSCAIFFTCDLWKQNSGMASTVLRGLGLLLLQCGLDTVCSATTAEQMTLRMLQPVQGTVVTAPVYFQASLVASSMKALRKMDISNTSVCVDIDYESVYCEPLDITTPSDLLVSDVQLGSHTARLVLRTSNASDLVVSERVAFTLVESQEYIQQLKSLQQTLQEQDLLSWARGFQGENVQELAVPPVSEDRVPLYGHGDPFNGSDDLLVIGVKTNLIERFAYRQAIRETWASKSNLLPGIEVLFIGCRLNATGALGAEYSQAIELERQIYGDLLTHELDCEDSYRNVVEKCTEFLNYVATRNPKRLPMYVMMADDDAYIRVNDLAHFLYTKAPQSKYYTGQVLVEQFGRPQLPIRDPTHKNYLSKTQYPMSELPPYASGGHYVLSIDCAQFIASNRNAFKGVGSLDDVSVALWLQTMDVRPRHSPVLKNIHTSDCDNDFVSYVDLSILAIRAIHGNLVSGRSFCHEFNRTTWSQIKISPSSSLKNETRHKIPKMVSTVDANANVVTNFEFSTVVQVEKASLQLIISTKIQFDSSEESFPVAYQPANELFDNFCSRMYNGFADKSSVGTKIAFCSSLQLHLRQIVSGIDSQNIQVTLWKHNLRDLNRAKPPAVIVYSFASNYAMVLLECVFASVFQDRFVRVMSEAQFALQQQHQTPPDVFVFSILDGFCGSKWESECQQVANQHIQMYGKTNQTTLIMIAGEPWNVDALDERVVLLSTVSKVNRTKHAYLPVASTCFAERMDYSPLALLSPRMNSTSNTSRRFCAYMYARCDRPQREYMFNLLDAIEPVDALGVCQGARHAPDPTRRAGRDSLWYNDDAAKIYERYKFVIAFENGQEPGYITEKLVNAFLAGSIPVYLGHSETVTRIFNSESFIDCGQFRTLRDCAARVKQVHESAQLYAKMRREPPVANVSAFYEAFSWHPDVPSTFLADELQKYLPPADMAL